MTYQGVLKKMQTEIGTPIQYYMVFKNDFLNVNQILNKLPRSRAAGNITHEILRLRSGSPPAGRAGVRLINFVSQNKSLTDLKTEIKIFG